MTTQNFIIDNGLTVTGTGGNITGATNIEASANIIAGENIVTLGTGGNITMTGGNITGATNIIANATHGNIVIGDVTATGSPGLSSTTSVTIVSGRGTTDSNVTLTTDGTLHTGNIVMAPNTSLTGSGASPAPSLSGFASVSAIDISAIGNITAGGNLDVDGEGTIGGNLTIVGNVNFSGGGTINQITSPFGYFTGNVDGSNALYAGVPGGTIVPNAVAQFTGDANSYMQVNMQNKNHGTQASIEYVVTGDLGTDTQDYIDIGFSSSSWDGTQDNSLGTAVAARDGWMYVQGGGGGGNLVLGTTTSGTKIKFNAGGPNSANTVATIDTGGFTATGNVTAGHLKGEAGNISNVQGANVSGAVGIATYATTANSVAGANVSGAVTYATTANSVAVANVSGIGNIATTNLDGSSSNVLYGNGVFAPASGGGSYGDSNVVTLLGAFGSNTVSTTGNVTAGNLKTVGNVVFTANTSNIVFNNTAYINGSGNAVGRDGSIMLVPYTGAGSAFAGVVIGGAGRLIAPNGSVHQIFNTSDVTFQVAIKTLATAATSTTTGGIQAGGGIGVVGNAYIGGSLVRTGAVTSVAWTTSGTGLRLPTATYTDNSTAAGTQTSSYIHLVDAPALAFSNAVTVTNAATMYVAAPTAGTNATITNPWSIIANGNVQVNGTGAISVPNLPAFRVYGSTSTVIIGGNTVNNSTTTTTVDYNQGSAYNNTTGVFTAPVAGIYHAFGTVRVANNNGLNQAGIIKNGTSPSGANTVAFWEISGNSATGHMALTGDCKLAVGDTLRLQVIAGNCEFDSNDSWGVTFVG